MKTNSRFQIGTGVTSILMIFIVLCLTTFAILSYSSANADADMTDRHIDYIEAYYNAYSKLNDGVAKIDTVAYSIFFVNDSEKYTTKDIIKLLEAEKIDDVEATFEAVGDNIKVFLSTDIKDEQQLKMEVIINTYDTSKMCTIDKCYVYTEGKGFIEEETLPDMWGG